MAGFVELITVQSDVAKEIKATVEKDGLSK